MPTLETERLRLRELTEADAPALLELYRDPTVMRFMGAPPSSVEVEAGNITAHRSNYYATRGYGLWGVVARDEDVIIGRCGLLDATIRDRAEVEISYLLAPDARGRGLATEAARAVLSFATSSLGLRRVVAVVHPDNEPSRRVAERLGMTCDGTTTYKTFGQVDLFVWEANHAAPVELGEPV